MIGFRDTPLIDGHSYCPGCFPDFERGSYSQDYPRPGLGEGIKGHSHRETSGTLPSRVTGDKGVCPGYSGTLGGTGISGTVSRPVDSPLHPWACLQAPPQGHLLGDRALGWESGGLAVHRWAVPPLQVPEGGLAPMTPL